MEEGIYEELNITSLQKLQQQYAAMGLEEYAFGSQPHPDASRSLYSSRSTYAKRSLDANPTPPPLPAPNQGWRSRMSSFNSNRSSKKTEVVTVVAPPVAQTRVCEIQDQDWFGSLELHSAAHPKADKLQTDSGCARSASYQKQQKLENIYTNQSLIGYSTGGAEYVDMRNFKRWATK